MLVSVASFLPIIIAGGVADLIGTTAVIFVMAITVTVIGVISVLTRGPLKETDARPAADPKMVDPLASALGADLPTWTGHAPENGAGSDGVAAPSLATTVPPMPVGPAGDMLVPTGVEPGEGSELAGAASGPAEETPDRVERG
jgi:hypothetical protein